MNSNKNWWSSDSEENYKLLNSGKSNYTKDEITYSFNEQGYRCDSFSDESEFPVLFMGCSFTEGIGLPLNEVWSYHLHNDIVKETNKIIPYWSLGRGGTSIDYAARCFYEYGPKLKPKYVFYLLSGISRREYKFETDQMQNWFPNASKLYTASDSFNTMSKVFVDPRFAYYQTLRSAMILNSVAANIGAKIFIFGLEHDIGFDEQSKIELFSKFDEIEYFTVDPHKPLSKVVIPDQIKDRPMKARDNSHPGAHWQYSIYEFALNNTKAKIFS